MTPKLVGGRPPLPWNLRSTWPTIIQTAQFRPIFAHSALTVRAGKKVQLALIGRRPRAFQRAIDKLCTLPLSPPKGGRKFQLLSKKVCCKVSSCEYFHEPCTLPPSLPKGGSKRKLLHLALPFISSLQVIVDDISNLICGLNIACPSLQTTNRPWNERCHVTWPILNF